MKTILVLTDFSISADYTADYALALAQQIKANLLLCNIFERPADEHIPDPKAWPRQACEENSMNDLGALMARLKTKLNKVQTGDIYKPEIEQCSVDRSADQQLAAITNKHNILLAVISAHSTGNLNGVFKKDHTWDIIEHASFPVMVIPYQTRFKPFSQIAFATAMESSDITVLASVAAIAKYSGSEILITNVETSYRAKNNLQKFFSQVPFKIAYPKISYQTIKVSNVVNFLKRQCAYIDLLVLVHHKRSFLQNLFGQNITRKMTAQPRKPMLIFPDNVIN